MTNIGGDVHRAAFGTQHLEILREGFKAPVNATAQHIEGHAFNLRQVAHDQLAVGRLARCNRKAAVANDRGGDTHRR